MLNAGDDFTRQERPVERLALLPEETTRAAMHQATPPPLPWLADIFDPLSERRAHLLQNCTEPELKRSLQDLGSLSLTARGTETAPAERILRARGRFAGL